VNSSKQQSQWLSCKEFPLKESTDHSKGIAKEFQLIITIITILISVLALIQHEFIKATKPAVIL
jgi:hypothetical protein